MKLEQMSSSSKALKNGLSSVGVIYLVGFIITLFSQSILNNLDSKPYHIFLFMVLLFVWKILPFIPFLFIVYCLFRFLIPVRRVPIFILVLVIIILFFAYGRLIWQGEFLHMFQFHRPDYGIRQWWASETRDWHFSLASLIATFYFIWKTFYKKIAYQSQVDSLGLVQDNNEIQEG